jgi:hypothetical protein
MPLWLYQLLDLGRVFVHLPQLCVCHRFYVIFLSAHVWVGAPKRKYEKLNTEYEELIFYLYAKCKDTCGGPKDPNGGPCSGFRRP